MTEIARGYDSLCTERCDLCNGLIEPMNPRVVCGTGSSLVVVYHNVCWDWMYKREAKKKEPLPGRRLISTEKGMISLGQF